MGKSYSHLIFAGIFTLGLLIVVPCSLAQGERKMCISIDDLPVNSTDHTLDNYRQITRGLLAALAKNGVPAIGFVNEGKLTEGGVQQIEENRNLLRLWKSAGMELGNHTYSHIDYNTTSVDVFESEIQRGEIFTSTLFPDMPNRIKYFRHPYLHTGNTKEKVAALRAVVKKLNYVEAPVTIDNSEWIFARAYDIATEKRDTLMRATIAREYIAYMISKTAYYEKASDNLFGRNIRHILLIHANALNANHLDALLSAFKNRGYKFISIADALMDEAYKSTDEFAGNAGISWIQRWAITQQRPKEFFADEPAAPVYILKYAGIASE